MPVGTECIQPFFSSSHSQRYIVAYNTASVDNQRRVDNIMIMTNVIQLIGIIVAIGVGGGSNLCPRLLLLPVLPRWTAAREGKCGDIIAAHLHGHVHQEASEESQRRRKRPSITSIGRKRITNKKQRIKLRKKAEKKLVVQSLND